MVFENVGKGIDLYPSVGLRHSSDSVRVNFGHSPFKYVIDEHVHTQRNIVWANVQSTRIDWNLLNGKEKNAENETGDATAKSVPLVPKGGALEEEQMKAPVRKLVLSYLAHHGYAKTARAFQAQCEGTDSYAMETDTTAEGNTRSSSSMTLNSEFDLRTRIEVINSVVKGDIDTAIALTQAHHPSVLEREHGLILFKLRCRKFIELILEASDALKRVQAEQAGGTAASVDGKQPHAVGMVSGAVRNDESHLESDGMDDMGAMDVDDLSPEAHHATSATSLADSPTTSTPTVVRDVRPSPPYHPHHSQTATPSVPIAISATSIKAKAALHTAIQYGQQLEADYKADGRPEVRRHLKRTFGVVAYADPVAAGGEVAEMVGSEARTRLANELNQAILGAFVFLNIAG
jgi:Ran-binding protein 9/10